MHINIWTRAALMLLLISGVSFLACMPRDAPVGSDMENDQAKQEEPIGKPGKRETDSYGDPLPTGAVARLGTVRFRHGNGVSFVAFSADGKRVVFSGQGELDNAIRMVETSTGKELSTFDLKPGDVSQCMGLSPDGNILALRLSNLRKPEVAFVLWDTTTGKELARIEGAQQPADVVVFSPNSKVLVTQNSQRIESTNNFQTAMKVWDARTGKLVHEFKDLEGREGRVNRPAFSPDGKRLAVTVSPHSGNLSDLQPTKGFFYDTATWRAVQPMAARPTERPDPWGARRYDREFLAYSPGGKLLVGGDWFNHIDFMKADTGELIEQARLVGVSGATAVGSLSFSHDRKMLSVVSQSGVVNIWEVTGTRKVLYNLDGAHAAAVFSPAEPLLVTGGGGWLPGYGRGYPGLRFWNPSTGKEILKNDSPAAAVQLTHWLPDGKLLAVSPAENSYRQWDWHMEKQAAKVPIGGKFTCYLWSAVSPDGKLLAVSNCSGEGNDEMIQLFDLANSKVIHRLESKMVQHPIGFTADGRFLLAGEETNVAIWDTADGKLSRRLDMKEALEPSSPDFDCFVSRSAVSGDGKTLAVELGTSPKPNPGEIDPGIVKRPIRYYHCVIDMATGKIKMGWRTGFGPEDMAVSALAFSPDSKMLAERLGQKINLRDSTTGALLHVLKCEKEWWEWTKQADALAFTPDSKKLIAADLLNNIYVWDVATGKELQKFTGHRGRIFSVSVSLDGRMFATASEDSTVLIWQLDGG